LGLPEGWWSKVDHSLREALHLTWRGKHLLFAAPFEVTLPALSTSTSGPSQETSKYDLMVMLYAEGLKNRLLMGALVERTLERKAERAWWVLCMVGDGGERGLALTCSCCQTHEWAFPRSWTVTAVNCF
jgi:hypothetical protein